jgi:hypothetical protein
VSRSDYILLGVDSVVRITAAMAFLFVLIPRMALPKQPGTTTLERLWWNLGVGMTALVLAGQLLSFGNLFTLPSLLLALLVLVIAARCITNREHPIRFVRRLYELAVIAAFNALDGRMNFRRRFRLALRRLRRRAGESVFNRKAAPVVAGWIALIAVSAALRFYRPFTTLDFGASDPYIHLYWLKLLAVGTQVDLSWGPYPRGLHFVLLSIVKVANIDEVLLMNFFGAFVGVLMTLGVADVTRRVTGSVRAGLLAGFLFATMVGGPGQYWIIGGRFDGAEVPELPRHEFSYFGEEFVFLTKSLPTASFDLLFWTFKRQTMTLPQELAVVLLFPTALFAIDAVRRRRWWPLIGFFGGVAAIASIHPGVLLPLLVVVFAAMVAVKLTRDVKAPLERRFWVTLLLALITGFSWLGIFAFHGRHGAGLLSYYSGQKDLGLFVPALSTEPAREAVLLFTSTTPVMIIASIVSFLLLVLAFFVMDGDRAARLKCIALATLLFVVVQIATSLNLPMFLDPARNCLWLAISIAIVLAIAVDELVSVHIARVPALVVLLIGLSLWTSRVPDLQAQETRDFVDATEYGSASQALLGISRKLKPFTWTIVTYGQEFPHVLGRGYHMPSAEFLERYDPRAATLSVPTQYVFVVVEKNPHPFQVNAWASQFSRTNLEQRLLAWCVLYQTTHDDMRVYLEDDNIRIYVIQRTEAEASRIARNAGS